MTSTEDQKKFEKYMKFHKITGLFSELTEGLIKDKPENKSEIYDFLIEKIQNFTPKGTEEFANDKKKKVVFVLGGPGSGKGTQCKRLATEFGFPHFSAGDLLRAECKKSDSKLGQMISNTIKEGKLVPGHVIITLLRNAILNHPKANDKNTYFLIDGFPREMGQAVDFENQVTPCQFCLFFDCKFDILQKRLLERGKTSGRSDDNLESIKKRFKTYQNQTAPVINYFKSVGKLKTVESEGSIIEVYKGTVKCFQDEMKNQIKNELN